MTSPGVRVLLTGFEPFAGDLANPSGDAVRLLAGAAPLPGVDLRTAVLPVVFGEAVDVLRDAVAEHDPQVVVCTGLAGGRSAVTPERVAVNLDDAPLPDNAGQQPVESAVVADGPVGYLSTLPVTATVEALRAAGVPAAVSTTAGSFVCNSVFYGLMHLAATERPGLVAGFVHVPWASEQVAGRVDGPPSLPLATLVDALRVCVTTAAAQAG